MRRLVLSPIALLLLGFAAGFIVRQLIYLSSAAPTAEQSRISSPSRSATTGLNQTEIDLSKFAATYRAATAIVSAVEVGVSYQKYSELLQSFALELSLAGDHTRSAREKELVLSYREALEICQDAQTLWGIDIQKGQKFISGNVGAYLSPLKKYDTSAYEIIKVLRKKYPLDIRGHPPNEAIIFDSSLKGMLTAAARQFTKANDLYRSAVN